MIFYLLFQMLRGVIPYLFDIFCERLGGMRLPVALDAFLFVRPVGGYGIRFSGNQIVFSTALGFFFAGMAMWLPARSQTARTARETRLHYLRPDPVRSYLYLVGATIGAVIGLNLLFELTRIVYQSEAYLETSSEQYASSFLLGILVFGLITPLAEELLFRGIIQNCLRRFTGIRVAVLVTAVLFGDYHGNLIQGIYGFLLGCLIGYAYEYFGDFRMAVAVHTIANIFAYCLTYMPVWDTYFVSWPVCLGFVAFSLFCVERMARQKRK